jgi:uncharacterized protein YuzE
MKVIYDKEADAAYIYLVDDSQIGSSWVKYTYSCYPEFVGGMINLDFDATGKLGGVEIMDASEMLTRDLLNLAE